MPARGARPKTTARELLRVVFVYKQLVIGVALAFAAIAGLAAYVSPDQYEARAKLWVRDETALLRNSGESPREQYERIQVAAANFREALLSRSVLAAVLEQVDGARFSRLRAADQSRLIRQLRRRIGFRMARSSEFGASQVIEVTVRDESRDRARHLLQRMLDEAHRLLQEVGLERARRLAEKTEREWQQARAELDQAAAALRQLVVELGAGLLDVQAMSGSPVGDSGTRQMLGQLLLQLAQLEARIVERRAMLDRIRSGDLPDELSGELAELLGQRLDHLARIRQAVADAEVRERVLQASMMDAHPELQEARERRVRLAELYRSELQRLRTTLEQELSVLESTARELREERDSLAEQLARIAGRYPEFLALRTDYQIREDALRQAALKREQARTQLAIASQNAVFVPLDGLQVSTRPVTLGNATAALAGGLLGLLCGVGLAFVANYYSHTVREPADLYRWGIDVPVLAAVPAVDDPLLLEGRRKVASSRMRVDRRRG